MKRFYLCALFLSLGFAQANLQAVIPRETLFGAGSFLPNIGDGQRPRLQQVAYEGFFFLQLRHRFVDLFAAEVVDWHALHNLPFPVADPHGKR